MPDVIETANRFRNELLANDAAALGRMARAYSNIYDRLRGNIDALLLETEGEKLTQGQITRLTRYKALMRQVADELTKFGGFVELTANEQAIYGIETGEEHARFLVSSVITDDFSIAAQFAKLPREAITQLLGFLSPDSPLYQRIQELAPFTAELVSDELINGIATGKAPNVTARTIESAFGQGLTNAMRLVRTVQLYSYREANRASYIANSDIVTGWYWHAELDSGTCVSCINQHGTFYPLTERLNDHHNGRCAMIPGVRGFPPPLAEDAGEQWFNQQPESVQRQMLGAGKFQAWQDGKFSFTQLSTNYDDEVYGTMKRETTLKELVANES